MLIWRLRNNKELQSITEELDAFMDKRLLLHMYNMATAGHMAVGI